jgi:hypothetical protein
MADAEPSTDIVSPSAWIVALATAERVVGPPQSRVMSEQDDRIITTTSIPAIAAMPFLIICNAYLPPVPGSTGSRRHENEFAVRGADELAAPH